MTWFLLAALVGPCAAVQIPREMGRWDLAAAVNLRSKGKKEEANEKLASAFDWFPKSPELLLQRAEWRLDDGDRDGALADCDRMLELGGEREVWLKAHALFLQNAGEFARAVDDYKRLDDLSQRSGTPSRVEALNGLAYAQALAKIDLDEALKNVNQALELQSENNEAILDTRGYIYHLQDHNVMALSDLDRAVKRMDASVAKARQQLAAAQADSAEPEVLASSQPRTLVEVSPQRLSRAGQLRSFIRSAAVIYYHRALVLAALDRTDTADADRAKVRQLIGREPDDTLF